MPNKHQTKIEFFSHLPRGRCGLKFEDFDYLLSLVKSPSARKVWIEIISSVPKPSIKIRSPSARKVWIEIDCFIKITPVKYCHLPRGRCGLKYS